MKWGAQGEQQDKRTRLLRADSKWHSQPQVQAEVRSGAMGSTASIFGPIVQWDGEIILDNPRFQFETTSSSQGDS